MDLNSSSLQLHFDIASKLNFACHQNSFPVLRNLQIENSSQTEGYSLLKISIESNPGFLKPKSWNIDHIGPARTITITDRDVQLYGGFLLNLTESLRATVTLRVEDAEKQLLEENISVELLSYNEWGGTGFMPELLASFSVPNDPVVDKILKGASDILRKAGKRDTLEGYQSKSRERVWEIVSAIYSSIANLNISYSEPPSSFERDGQKIRLPQQIWDGKMATCLDTAMLFSSVLEQAGLSTLIALPESHALVGVWLQPEGLSSIVVDEAEVLRKRVQLKELVVIESTFVTSHPCLPFSKALAAAESILVPENDSSFRAAIDIKRARMHRILPLGLKSNVALEETEGPSENITLALESAPSLPDFEQDDDLEKLPETPQGRLDRWQRKLLDLTLRNPLLNFKASKGSLKIICPDPGLLEDKLAAGEKISISPIPQTSSQKQDQDIHRQRIGESLIEEYAREALGKKQVLVDLTDTELSKRSVELYRKAQTSLQEGGSNTLFLALGFLLWKREDKGDQKLRAPLILLPVGLERQSVRSGVKLVAHDDEPRFNTTLLEMLRKDFEIDISSLASDLPTDHSGIDVPGIWNLVRKKIKDSPGFEVIEDVVLGHFSFAKYLMWKDLVDRTDALRENPVVKHLLDTPREPYKSEIEFVDRTFLDKNYAPADLLTPLPGDSSQMASIATADRGKDFVIIGPPGTGKSQTISNLIAHLLGKGKTVLFVSEKTAALEVVYRRLDDIGLGKFCLQLHSNKAKKADVLNQLKVCWESSSKDDASAWKEKAAKLKRLRDRLNEVSDRLHSKYRNGLTPHYAIGLKVREEEYSKPIKLSWPNSGHHGEQDLKNMRETVQKLAIQAGVVNEFSNTPFKIISSGEWSPNWETQVTELATALSASTRFLEKSLASFSDSTKITFTDHSISKLDAAVELAGVLLDSYRKQTGYALESNGSEQIEKLEQAVGLLKNYAEQQASLSCSYDPLAWKNLDGELLGARWQESVQSWWLKRIITQWKIAKEISKGGANGKPDPEHDIPILKTLKETGEKIDSLDRELANIRLWKGYTTEPHEVEALQKMGERIRTAVGKLADDADKLAELKTKLRNLLNEANDLLAADGTVGRTAKSFIDAYKIFSDRHSEFESLGGANIKNILGDSPELLEQIKQTTESIAARKNELRDWCAWLKRRNEAVDLDLLPLVKAIEDGAISNDEIENVFETAYCAWWSGVVISEDNVLRTFSSPEHNRDILDFRKADSEFQKLTSEYIAAKLSGKLTDLEDVKKNSQWGTLKREIQKKARHKPIRTLAQEIPDVLSKLAPCMMMSPLSVAQYLPANQALFDVVIFDEASQITVWDAVGSIARGKQVIIAGDPKQMPPTNFFGRTDEDPDGEIDIEGDLESILDEMLGASIPAQTLNLHYRSRRESLIAFSNAKYYDNALITFPAPVNPDCGVSLIRPDGFYARGGARHNEGEARAIVAEVVRRLTHMDEDFRKKSLGVVTFNSEQQSLIENLLDEARSNNPDIEWAFSKDNVLEPVFVKNLETVQGDERDVILFSITYGPDQSGHITMNFGPLNKQGGERRLNVAMTRARSEMVVFSTLHPDQIDLSRSQARAVADLKHFLQYAERGTSVLGSFVEGSKGDFESPLEVAIARALKEKGWQIHPQVGVSAYRIDLAIVHPEKPGVYLAGVECDGAMYHSSAFAKERDKIRQAVLEGLGWNLIRVWSTDWWTNKTKAINELHQKLEELLQLTSVDKTLAFEANKL